MLKDIVGRAEDELEVADGRLLKDVFEHYASRFPRVREIGPSIVLAKNQKFTPLTSTVADGEAWAEGEWDESVLRRK